MKMALVAGMALSNQQSINHDVDDDVHDVDKDVHDVDDVDDDVDDVQ